MFTVSATAKVGDTFTQGILKFTVLTEEGDSGTVNMNIQVSATYRRNYYYTLNIPENCNKSNIRYKIVSISKIVRVYKGNIRPPYYNFPHIIGHISIPNSVTTIGDGAFGGCTGLTGIEIPNSVTTIGNYAFNKCTGLTGIEIPNSVTTIGNYAFNECTGLTSVILGDSVTTIGNYAFNKCTGLTGIEIPNSVTTIGNYAFNECTGLTSVILGDSVTTIGDYAFNECTGLTGNLVIPNSVTTIGSHAFHVCSGLTGIEIPNSVTTIGDYAFFGYNNRQHTCCPSHVNNLGENSIVQNEVTIPISACNSHLYYLYGELIFYMGNDIEFDKVHILKENRTFFKPSVYALLKGDAYKFYNFTDKIPVTFPEGQEYITLCRDFDVDLRHTNDNLPLNIKPLKAYIVRDADMDKGTAYLDELTYIPSRLKANVEGYKGVDEYVGVVLSGTPGYTYYVQMGEDDYSKGIDGQMTVEKALSLDKDTAYNYDVNLVESASAPHPTLVGAAGDMEVKPTETIDGVTYKNYGLKDGKFVEYEAEGVIPYNHAYLHVPVTSASGAKKSFTMEVRSSSPTTGISEVETPADSVPARKTAYNLMGMRVGSGYHGIVIVDGKKFIRK